MKIKHLLSALIAVAMLFPLSSCNDGDNLVSWANFVTYDGSFGGYPQITWQGVNNAPSVTLSLEASIPSDVPAGSRLFLSFLADPNETLTDGMTVVPSQLYLLETHYPQLISETPPEGWASEPSIYINYLFRSGRYLNLECMLPGGTKPETFKINFYVDDSTLNEQNIIAYLSYENEASQGGAVLTTTHRTCIDVTELLAGTAKTLTVYVNNSNVNVNPGMDMTAGEIGNMGKTIIIPLK